MTIMQVLLGAAPAVPPSHQYGLKIIKTTVPATNGVGWGAIVFAPDKKMYGLWSYGPNTLSGGRYLIPATTATQFQFLVFNTNGSTATSSAFNNSTYSTMQKFDLDNQSRVDSAGNVYFMITSLVSGARVAGAVKYNSSGAFVSWNNYSISNIVWPLCMSVVKSTGEIYYAGSDTVFKTAAAGTISWQRKVTTGTESMRNFGTRVVANPLNGGVYVICYFTSITYRIYSIDTNGTSLAQVNMSNSPYAPDIIYADVDTSGNLYVCARSLGQTAVVISKFNSSLVLQWSKSITTPRGGTQTANPIAVNSAKNKVFFAYPIQSGSATTSPAQLGVICFNSSTGSTEWTRQIESNVMMGAVSFGEDLCISSSDDVYVLTSSTQNSAVPQITAGMITFPVDGSKLGTYATYTDPTYGAITTTYSSSSPTIADSGLTTSASSVALATSTAFTKTARVVNSTTAALNVVANVNI